MPHKAVTAAAAFALRALGYNAHRQFQRQLQNPAEAQNRLLETVIRDISQTDYGRAQGIHAQHGYDAFAAQLPLQDYDSFQPWIKRQLAGEPAITPHKVRHVEPTSGSSCAVKHIPYTRPLLNSFSRMFRIWAYDLLSAEYKPDTGRIFMSLSHANGDGFNDERDYLGTPLRQLLSPFLVLPKSRDMPAIAKTLAAEHDLEVISVWSPSYLLELLAQMPDMDWRAAWSKLKLISCWDSAQAAPLADELRVLFPDVIVQGKGLLATEAPLTVPLAQGCAPLLGDVFFEFEMPDGTIKRLHELKTGERGNLVITQRGGLTRYRMGDTVQAGEFIHGTPSLTFLGRSAVCDIAGEKLNGVFVREALQTLLPNSAFTLVPVKRGYVLLTEQPVPDLAEDAEGALCAAYHYGVARRLGQLSAVQVVAVPQLVARLRAFHTSRGMKSGDIKDCALMTDATIAASLLRFLDETQPLVQRSAA